MAGDMVPGVLFLHLNLDGPVVLAGHIQVHAATLAFFRLSCRVSALADRVDGSWVEIRAIGILHVHDHIVLAYRVGGRVTLPDDLPIIWCGEGSRLFVAVP